MKTLETYLRLFLVNIALATPKCVERLFVTFKLPIKSLVTPGFTSRIAWAISSWVRSAAAVLSSDNCNCGWIGDKIRLPMGDGNFEPCKKESSLYCLIIHVLNIKTNLKHCPSEVSHIIQLIIAVPNGDRCWCRSWNGHSCWPGQFH